MIKKLMIILGVILVMFAGMFFSLTDGLSEGAALTINGIDLSAVPDGSYTGVYAFKRWTNKVVVHVKDKQITAVEADRNLAGADSGEIFRRVMETQNTTIDAVSGATVTTKAYLKAIEYALQQ